MATFPVDTLPYVVRMETRITNRIYAAGCNFLTGAGSMVVVIDGSNNHVITDIPLNQSGGLGTQGIALNLFTNRVYVSDYDDNQEVVIDGATNQIAARVDLQGTSTRRRCRGPADQPRLGHARWSRRQGGHSRWQLPTPCWKRLPWATSSSTTWPSIQLPGASTSPQTVRPRAFMFWMRRVVSCSPRFRPGKFADDVSLDQLSNLIFVTDGQGNQVFEVDGSTNAVVATVPLERKFSDRSRSESSDRGGSTRRSSAPPKSRS